MDTLAKFAGERYQNATGTGAAISTRTGIEVLMDLLASLSYEDLSRYVLTPNDNVPAVPTAPPTTGRQAPR